MGNNCCTAEQNRHYDADHQVKKNLKDLQQGNKVEDKIIINSTKKQQKQKFDQLISQQAQIPEMSKINQGQFQISRDLDITLRKPTKLKNKDIIYQGQWLNGQPHGYGKMYLANGNLFEGFFEAGKANGKGRLIYKDGSYFEGQIVDNYAEGQGVFQKQNYSYKGQFHHNELHGKGKQTTPVSTFQGTFLHSSKHYGILKWNQYTYVGYFDKEGRFDKYGKLIASEGTYTGQFCQGVKQGIGQYKKNDGKIYRGGYFNNKKNGQGIFYTANGSILYKGQWKDNLPDGDGIVFTSGSARQEVWVEGIAKSELERLSI